MTTPREVVIDAAFNGPPNSAHGGYACATFARATESTAPVTVTLLRPPPLNTPMTLTGGGRGWLVHADDALIATAAPAPAASSALLDPPPPVDAATAAAATRAFAPRAHPFPTCFVCGHDRPDGSGLRLAPGPVPERPNTAACQWVPPGAPGRPVSAELIWSALDCPGGWVRDPAAAPAVLTRMAAEITGPVEAGRPHIVVAALRREQGRTRTVGTAVYAAEPGSVSRPLAAATAIWTLLAEPTRPPVPTGSHARG
ncbi:hypothetical protein ACWDSJ_23570 [Nocardia sp. NPDC003482]